MKEQLKKFWEWIKTDGKTTLVAVAYATVETLIALPNFHTMTTKELISGGARVALVTLIGILAKDRAPKDLK